jgi:hypothetical protein
MKWALGRQLHSDEFDNASRQVELGTTNLDGSSIPGNLGICYSLLGLAGAPIYFVPSGGLVEHNIYLGNRGDTVTVNTANVTPTVMLLHAGSGNDTINVANSAGPLTIYGGSGNTALTVDGSLGNLFLYGGLLYQGGSGSNSLTLKGSLGTSASVTPTTSGSGSARMNGSLITFTNLASVVAQLPTGQLVVNTAADIQASNVTLTDHSITWQGASTRAPVTLGNLASLELDLGSGGNNVLVTNTVKFATVLHTGAGNDTVNVQATLGLLDINGDNGQDTVTIGSLAPTVGGTLANILGEVDVENSAGQTALIVDDSSDSSARQAVLNGYIANLAPALIAPKQQLSSLTVYGGKGGNTFNVLSTPSGVPITLYAGSGNNTVHVQATSELLEAVMTA